MKTFLALFLLVIVAVPAAFANSSKTMEIRLKNGQVFTGQVVKQTPDKIVFNMDGATFDLTPAEIDSQKEVAALPAKLPVAPDLGQQMKKMMNFPNMSKLMGKSQTPAKAAAPASSVWGKGPRTAAQAPEPKTKKVSQESMIDVYQKSMSKESLEKWKQDSISQMGQGRNPFVEAAKGSQKCTVSQAASEAKLKELESKGY